MYEEEPKYWEPYTFKVGDLVRIKVENECAIAMDTIAHERISGKNTTVTTGRKGHPNILNNKFGIVYLVDRTEKDGHYYTVVVFNPPTHKGVQHNGQGLAAIELEPATFTVTNDMIQQIVKFSKMYELAMPYIGEDTLAEHLANL